MDYCVGVEGVARREGVTHLSLLSVTHRTTNSRSIFASGGEWRGWAVSWCRIPCLPVVEAVRLSWHPVTSQSGYE